MTAVVMVEGGAIALLAVLVFGLLRTQRRIVNVVRSGGLAPPNWPAEGAPSPRFPGSAQPPGGAAPALRGEDLQGRSVSWEPHGRAVLAFLTSGCVSCAWWWEQLGRPGRLALPGVVVVTPDPGTDSPVDISPLAGGELRVIMSSDAWSDYGVRAGATFVVVNDGLVQASGVASDWNGLMALVTLGLTE